MRNLSRTRDPVHTWIAIFSLGMLSCLVAIPVRAQTAAQTSSNPLLFSTLSPAGHAQIASTVSAASQNVVASGTILPVVLRSSLSFEKCKPGQILRGKIAQDVPLPNGSKIRKGTTIEGHVVDVTPTGKGTSVSIRFDKLYIAGQQVPVVTNLRPIAGSLAVRQTAVSEEAPGEGSPYDWLPTTQIGGDSIYGFRGSVVSADDPSKVIGKSVAYGVLVPPTAKEGTGCRGALNGNDSPQALWVFSGDACGTYGIEHLTISHAGRTDPLGTIVLASQTPKLSLRNGDALLLRVD